MICLTETHLHEQSDVSYLKLDNYHPIIHRDHSGHLGGGVAILVASHLFYKRIKFITDPNDLEVLWVN